MYGRNEIDVEVKSYGRLFVEEVSKSCNLYIAAKKLLSICNHVVMYRFGF